MNPNEIILKTFNQLFDTDFSSLDIPRESLPEWDSMKHAELLILLQKNLQVKFRTQDIIQIQNANDLIGAYSQAKK